MFNRFLKVSSPTGQQRWINLDRVTRVTHATDSSGCEVLVFCFDGQEQVKIHGTDTPTLDLIKSITDSLNLVAATAASAASAGTPTRLAA